jgi:hypothetical protein
MFHILVYIETYFLTGRLHSSLLHTISLRLRPSSESESNTIAYKLAEF